VNVQGGVSSWNRRGCEAFIIDKEHPRLRHFSETDVFRGEFPTPETLGAGQMEKKGFDSEHLSQFETLGAGQMEKKGFDSEHLSQFGY
jgi:hypothetical protein